MVWLLTLDADRSEEAHLKLFGSASPFPRAAFDRIAGTPLLFGKDGYLLDPNAHLLRKARQTASTATRKTRASHLRCVLDHFEAADWDWRIASSRFGFVNHYRMAVRGPNPAVSKQTWNQRMSAFWAFVDDLSRRGVIDAPDYEREQLHEGGKEEPNQRGLTPDQYRRFIAAGETDRDVALVAALRATGMRVGEAHAIRLCDVPNPADIAADFDAGRRTIVGKGRKEREIYWTVEAARRVARYMSQERALAVDVLRSRVVAGAVDVSATHLVAATDPRTGRRTYAEPADAPLWLASTGHPLSVKLWDKVFAKMSKASKVRCTPHGLRHTYAVATLAHLIAEEARRTAERLQRGSPHPTDLPETYYLGALEELRRLLGHAFISTTQGYLRHVPVFQDLLRAALEASDKAYAPAEAAQ